jgi:hypothetical protein
MKKSNIHSKILTILLRWWHGAKEDVRSDIQFYCSTSSNFILIKHRLSLKKKKKKKCHHLKRIVSGYWVLHRIFGSLLAVIFLYGKNLIELDGNMTLVFKIFIFMSVFYLFRAIDTCFPFEIRQGERIIRKFWQLVSFCLVLRTIAVFRPQRVKINEQ